MPLRERRLPVLLRFGGGPKSVWRLSSGAAVTRRFDAAAVLSRFAAVVAVEVPRAVLAPERSITMRSAKRSRAPLLELSVNRPSEETKYMESVRAVQPQRLLGQRASVLRVMSKRSASQ